jgi:arabinose-5-phosphate isomerase
MLGFNAVSLSDYLMGLLAEVERLLLPAMQSLDTSALAQLSAEIQSAPAVVFVGVGKSGLIAEKTAATLSSIGIRALCVHPVEAQHGDLGRIQAGDLVICMSKSGESEELLSLLPSLRMKRARLWAITSNPRSRLAASVDASVQLPDSRELDPHNVVPTTSTLLQLLVGDLLAMAVLFAKGTTLEEFHANHPAGRIGRRLHLRVQNVMMPLEQTPVARPHEPLFTLLARLSQGCSGCLVITDASGEINGIFTDGDLRRALEYRGPSALNLPISELATAQPRCLTADLLAVDALRLMESGDRPISVMPVRQGCKLIGLVRLHDLLKAGL